MGVVVRQPPGKGQHGDRRATLAIDLFCRSVRHWIASMATSLGGIDALVEMKLGAIEEGSSAAGTVRYGSAQGAAVQFLPMPYVLDALDL